jgi:hypothetical protein
LISRTCLSSSAHYESQEQLVFIAWAVHKELKKTQQPKRALQLINALLPAAMGEDVTRRSPRPRSCCNCGPADPQ